MQIAIRRTPGSGFDADRRVVRVAALGDLMLSGEWELATREHTESRCLGQLQESLANDDIVFGNLETTIDATGAHIPKQPRVIATQETLRRCLATIGVNIVSLANNHAFDAYVTGFNAVSDLLASMQVLSFGAGQNAAEASHPCIVERKGVRLGWLGYVARDTQPSEVATGDQPGVNGLGEERAIDEVRALKNEVHHVVVSLHWGIEYCALPSPEQIILARRLIDEGASLIIGHHAHAVQGVEAYKRGVIAYNLGNATTTDFFIDGRLAIKQSRRTRSSFVLRAGVVEEGIQGVELVPFRTDRGVLRLHDDLAQRLLERANRRLAAGRSGKRWRSTRFYEDVVLRTAWKLDPRVARSLNGRHVARFFRNIVSATRGRGPA